MASATDLLVCPVCGVQMNLTRSAVPSQVTCPACHRQVNVALSNRSASSGEVDGFSNLPSPVLFTEPVRAPKRSLWRAFTCHVADVSEAGHKLLKPASIIILFLLIATGIAAGIYTSRKNLSLEKMETLLPGHDSPEQVLDQYERTFDAMVEQMNLITDAKSRDQGIPLLNRLESSCQAIAARAVALGPLTENDFRSLEDRLQNQFPEQYQRVADAARTLNAKRSLSSSKLQAAIHELNQAAKQCGPVIETAWKPIPTPETDDERVAHEIKMIRYRVWGAAVSVTNDRAYHDLESVFDAAATELESILVSHFSGDQETGVGLVSSSDSRYDDELLSETESRLAVLQSQFGDPRSAAPFERYRDAATALRNVQATLIRTATAVNSISAQAAGE